MSRVLCRIMVAFLLVSALAYPAWGGELPRVLLQRAERFLAMGKLQAAIDNDTLVIERFPGTLESAEAHNDRGVAYARMGDLDQAIADYHAALDICSYPLAQYGLGKVYAERLDQTGDESYRALALEHYRAFASYLESDAEFPRVVSYNYAELKEYVRSELERLEAGNGGE